MAYMAPCPRSTSVVLLYTYLHVQTRTLRPGICSGREDTSPWAPNVCLGEPRHPMAGAVAPVAAGFLSVRPHTPPLL